MLALLLWLTLAYSTPPVETVLAPRPYTTEQIRDSMPKGTVLRFKIVSDKGESIREMVVTDATAETCAMSTEEKSIDGKQVLYSGAGIVPWEELRNHATWPAAEIALSEATITVPAGTYDTVVYTHRSPESGTVVTYWFAKTLPGPPIQLTVTQDKQETERMELIFRSSAPE